ncbi:LysR family transcriptional regulator [Photorhabdus temperata]|uniref:LysR family transcriptional regulator n=1 Tax=Photorhabdus temperata TaxID=574560 RepID=UPI00038A44A1|nr:LysR family transcriptional regulator [Photorhabdus temperata]EQB98705.1 LysR family transcriptional regulator [Photorhabdus temperata subsp. temperata M1021]
MKRHISLDQLDFRLLNVFITIFRERHVGRAADTLGMSQPTVSTLLARLRRISGDPLFIRSAQGMQPTVLARNWAEPVASALTMLESALNAPSDFDAATSQRTFSVYMTDVGQMLMLNRLISRIETTAPGIRIQTIGTWEGTLADQLDDRSIDIAFGLDPST